MSAAFFAVGCVGYMAGLLTALLLYEKWPGRP